MSFCRWAPGCDVYAYEHVDGGFVIHVGAVGAESDGAKMRVGSFSEYRDVMLNLRRLGYRFPDYALESDEHMPPAVYQHLSFGELG